MEEEDRATKRQRGLGFTYTATFHDLVSDLGPYTVLSAPLAHESACVRQSVLQKAPIGLTFDMTAGQETRVMAVQADSPAAKAKVQVGLTQEVTH